MSKTNHRVAAAKTTGTRHARARAKHAYGQANILTPHQYAKFVAFVEDGGYSVDVLTRDIVLVKLSYNLGLRVCEMSGLQWKRNILDASGKVKDYVHITADISKRVRERFIVLRPDVKAALVALRKERPKDVYVIHAIKGKSPVSERAKDLDRGQVHPNSLTQYWKRMYRAAGLEGCSSHSGRRTLITTLGRRCNEVGASLRDVQDIAGHVSLETTYGYLAPLEAMNHAKLMAVMF